MVAMPPLRGRQLGSPSARHPSDPGGLCPATHCRQVLTNLKASRLMHRQSPCFLSARAYFCYATCQIFEDHPLPRACQPQMLRTYEDRSPNTRVQLEQETWALHMNTGPAVSLLCTGTDFTCRTGFGMSLSPGSAAVRTAFAKMLKALVTHLLPAP